jgi:NAD dependent epimerase/dehydratase family enzyme
MNLVAPEPVTMRDFARLLGRTLGRPVWLPVPISLAGLVLGRELAEAMVPGQRIVPRVVLDSDYRFGLPRLSEALEACLGSAGSSPGKLSR